MASRWTRRAICARGTTATGGSAGCPTSTPSGLAVSDGTRLPTDEALRLLDSGELELEGRLVDASNTTLRAFVTLDGVTARCVYKPVRGERPLWDFPDGTLAGREVAAHMVSAATGWDVVPLTLLRDGPLGVGACQIWVDEPDDIEPMVGFVPADELPPAWLRVSAAKDETGRRYLLAHADDPNLARMALFDAVVNNADRKGGHVLRNADGPPVRGGPRGVLPRRRQAAHRAVGLGGPAAVDAEDRETLVALRRDLDGSLR